MQLTETEYGKFRIVSISEGVASAALELHQGYFTYYWRSRFGAYGFLELIQKFNRKQDIATTSLTVIDNVGNVVEVPSEEADANISSLFDANDDHASLDERLSLIRFEGPGQSWVWQYAPDNEWDRLSKYSDAPYRSGLGAYAGCASSGNHEALFATANIVLASSAIEARALRPYLDIFERYLTQWRERKESWETK